MGRPGIGSNPLIQFPPQGTAATELMGPIEQQGVGRATRPAAAGPASGPQQKPAVIAWSGIVSSPLPQRLQLLDEGNGAVEALHQPMVRATTTPVQVPRTKAHSTARRSSGSTQSKEHPRSCRPHAARAAATSGELAPLTCAVAGAQRPAFSLAISPRGYAEDTSACHADRI